MGLLLRPVLTFIYTAALVATSAKTGDNAVADQIAAIENQTGTRIGVAVIDTETNKRIEYRSNQRFPMCSTFKVLAVAAVLQRVDRGEDHLNRFVP